MKNTTKLGYEQKEKKSPPQIKKKKLGLFVVQKSSPNMRKVFKFIWENTQKVFKRIWRKHQKI